MDDWIDDVIAKVISDNIEVIASHIADEIIREAGLWDKLKNIVHRAIHSVGDFIGVAKQNGFMVIDDIDMSSLGMTLESKFKVKKDEQRGLYLQQTTDRGKKPRTQKRDKYDPAKGSDKFTGDKMLSPCGRVLVASKDLLKYGNRKLDARIGVWCLPCWKTCPESTEFCHEFCYARKPEGMYNQSLPYRMDRYYTSLDSNFTSLMITGIRQAYKDGVDIIRIHESGDFYDKDYFYKWMDVARGCPQVRFMAFTKVYKLLENMRDKPENMVFNGSIDPNYELPTNFYDEAESIDPETGEVIMQPVRNKNPNHQNEIVYDKATGLPKMEPKKDKVNWKEESTYYEGSTNEKIRSFLKNPNVDGLALIIPKGGATLQQTLNVLNQGLGKRDRIKPSEVFMCPYKETGGCGEGMGPKGVELCLFCWLPRNERLTRYGARHVAFISH